MLHNEKEKFMIREGLCYDDVMLVPQYSEIESRSNIDTSVILPKINVKLNHPIVPANMKTIVGLDMARAALRSKGLTLIHRFMSIEEQLNIPITLSNEQEFKDVDVWNYIGFSIGVKPEDYKNVDHLVNQGMKIVCVDVAHANSKLCLNMCNYISNKYPYLLLIAGNVATGNGASNLWKSGVDIVRVGIGNGSICTTRIQTGNGVPQLTALMDVFQCKENLELKLQKPLGIMADGGAKEPGDLVKGLCFSDLVMVGNMFAGTNETPGESFLRNGSLHKKYAGSSTYNSSHVEGVEATVFCKGKFADVLNIILDGITSGLSYQGVNNLIDLKKEPEFIRITPAGLRESHHHDVFVV